MFILLHFVILSVNERDDDDDERAVLDIWRVRRDVAMTRRMSKDYDRKLMLAMPSSLTNRVKNHSALLDDKTTKTFRHVTACDECSHRDVITYVDIIYLSASTTSSRLLRKRHYRSSNTRSANLRS